MTMNLILGWQSADSLTVQYLKTLFMQGFLIHENLAEARFTSSVLLIPAWVAYKYKGKLSITICN